MMLAALAMIGCTSSKTMETAGSAPALHGPRARIYRIEPRYADLVPVTIANGRLISYPAPGDVGPSTAPLPLDDGWLLDRQGVNAGTRFVKWTRVEYNRLETAPTPEAIKAAVVHQARITELVELPMAASKARTDTAAVNQLIKEGLPGCTPLIKVFRLEYR